MMAKWLCRAAIRWCGNGGWRHKSLVFRFDLRCFQIQTTRFPTKIQGFTHSIHHFQTQISPISHTIPQLHDAIPSFPDCNFDTSTYHSIIFKHHFPNFPTPFHHFQTKISANQHTNRPFPNSDMPLSNSDCSISPVFQAFARFICGENMVRKWQNAVRKRQNCGVFSACTCLISCIFVSKVAKWWCDCGGWWCGCGVFVFGFFMI